MDEKSCVISAGTSTSLTSRINGMTTRTHTHTLLQYVARFDEGGEIFGFGGGGYKESWLWCSLFVGFPSLFVAPSGEKPALPMCLKGTSLSTISRVFVPIIFVEQSVVVDVEGVGRGFVAVCTRISSQEYVYDK